MVAARLLKGKFYGEVETNSLLDDGDLKRSLPVLLRKVVPEAKPEGTIMLFAAGHGMQGEVGRSYIVARSTKPKSYRRSPWHGRSSGRLSMA